MTKPGLRTHRVAELIKAELGRMFIEEFQDQATGLLTVTRVQVTADLRTAEVFLSQFSGDREGLMNRLKKSQGFIRRRLATRVRLKYNPQLIFHLDLGSEHEERINQLIESVKKHGT